MSEQLHESALYRQMVDLERKIDALVERRKARQPSDSLLLSSLFDDVF